MEFHSVDIKPPEGVQLILAQSHFIKTVEDVFECMVNCVPGIKFGIAFCEASGLCLVRHDGNDKELEALAADHIYNIGADHIYNIGAGHSLLILIKDAYPINVLPRLNEVPEIASVFCATSNPVQVVVAETPQGRAILGVVDGFMPKGIETEREIQERKQFLRDIGYKK